MAADAGSSRRGRPAGRILASLAAAAAATALVSVTAACGTSHDPGSRGMIVVRDHANGKTVHVRVGQRVELILSSDYWRLHGSSSQAVLTQDGKVRFLPRPKDCPNIPGLGCIPFETTFKALSTGTAVITASRRTCGEALKCQPSQEHFKLTVIVG